MSVVCDYSFGRPAPSLIKADSYIGAMRYLATLPNTKVITLSEMESLFAAGLSVGLVWEGVEQEAEAGYAAGVAHATEALRQANLLNWPSNRPIYFVLEDPTKEPSTDWPAIQAYCQGLISVLGIARVGGYGSQALLENLFNQNLISYGWQVGGWSSSVSHFCHLYQREATTVASVDLEPSIDEDAVLKDDWGGWDGTTTPPVVNPTPPVSPPIVTTIYSEDNMQAIAVPLFTTNADGWFATDVPIPVGKTKNDVVSVICDWASGYDPQGWHAANGGVDFQSLNAAPNTARIVIKSDLPNDNFTARVFVAN